MPHNARRVGYALIGSFLGWSVWVGLIMGPFALWSLPILWASTADASEAAALMIGYYATATAGTLWALNSFYGPAAAVAGWVGCTLLLAGPFILARRGAIGARWRAAGIGLRYGAALLAVSMPPLGVIGMASPWCAATASFPGLGLVGLGLGGLAGSVLAAVTWGYRRSPSRAYGLTGLAVVTALSAGALLPTPASSSVPRIEGLVSRLRETVSPSFAHVLRQNIALVGAVKKRLAYVPPHTLLVLPEDAAEHWQPLVAALWWPVALDAYRHHDTVALGIYARLPHDQHKRDGLLLMGRHAGLIGGRQPVPLADWAPWKAHGAKAHWTRLGSTPAFGRPAAVLICYEQLLVWPVAETFLGSSRPTVLIGASNHWWLASDASEARMQARTLRDWGRLYGVPVVMADNRPPRPGRPNFVWEGEGK